MRFLAVVLAVPVLFVGWQMWRDHALEHDLRPIAAGVAGRSVQVDCQSYWASLLDAQSREGEVMFDANGVPEPKIFLTRNMCERLHRFRGRAHHGELDCLHTIDWGRPDALPFSSPCFAEASGTIYAILVLAHESYHTAGVTDEAAANCFAIQAMAWTAIRLGAPVSEGELLARAMLALEPAQGPEYGTSDCAPGGRLDLHPETSDFPTEHPIVAPLGRGGRWSPVS
jgi:hypothetical protein